MKASTTNIDTSVTPVMHRQAKKQQAYSRHLLAWCCAVLLLLIWMPGCLFYHQPPDPLAGWHVYLGAIPPQIADNYQEYIKELPTRERLSVHSETFFKDDSGRFAVRLHLPVDGTWKDYVLFYDDTGKRVKVLRYNAGHYMS